MQLKCTCAHAGETGPDTTWKRASPRFGLKVALLSDCPLLCLCCMRHRCLWTASEVGTFAGCQHCLPMTSCTMVFLAELQMPRHACHAEVHAKHWYLQQPPCLSL